MSRGHEPGGSPRCGITRCERPSPHARAPSSLTSAAGGDRGSATVLLLAVIAVALVVGVGAVALGRAADARGVAQAAADLAAIAAAQAAQDAEDPCAVAATVAAANGAQLRSCAVLPGPDVLVGTAVLVSPLVGWTTIASAQARAGPVR